MKVPKNRVLTKELDTEKVIKRGSLYFVDEAKSTHYRKLQVVYSSDTSKVKKGDIVYISKFAGDDVPINGEDFVGINFWDIILIEDEIKA